MKPVLIIAPHKEIEYVAKEVIKNYDDVEVKLALLDRAIEVAKYAEKQGVEAIISRGGTARIIKEAVPATPVIEVQVSPYDMLNAIYTAKKYGKNIFIVGFRNIIQGVEAIGSILDANIHVYYMDDEEDGKRYIRQLIGVGEKIDVLFGGTVAENLALDYNIPTVLLETGAAAIESSVKEAIRIVEVARKEREKTEQFKAILHYINEGIVSIDGNKNIITFNSAAGKMIGVSPEEVIGRSIEEVIPDTKLIKVMEKSRHELGDLFNIGKTQVLANRVPIVIKNQTVGAVETLQDVTKIQEYEQRIRSELLKKGHIAKYSFSDIIGESKAILTTKEKAKKYAPNNSTILIIGESGTGKEMFAQSIHLESHRKSGPFVAVNCAAISQSLLESELFGYEEGAFTGARKTGKTGLFVEAHGGTIFLDEIGEMGIELQAKLLRVLQEREVRPIGANKFIPIDIRVIAATNKKLVQEVEKGTFRSDLYYRLNILKLKVPALKEREEDVKLLSRYFLSNDSSRYNKSIDILDDALDELQAYSWPGNIRELENIIERLVVLNDDVITKESVKEIFMDEKIQEEDREEEKEPKGEQVEGDYEDMDSLEEVKKRHIHRILSECEGNQTLAANRLGISRTHLWRIINDYKK